MKTESLADDLRFLNEMRKECMKDIIASFKTTDNIFEVSGVSFYKRDDTRSVVMLFKMKVNEREFSLEKELTEETYSALCNLTAEPGNKDVVDKAHLLVRRAIMDLIEYAIFKTGGTKMSIGIAFANLLKQNQ